MSDLDEMRRIAKDILPEQAKNTIKVTYQSLERMISKLLGFTVEGVGKAQTEIVARGGTIRRVVVPHIRVHGIKVHMEDTQLSYVEYETPEGATERIDL